MITILLTLLSPRCVQGRRAEVQWAPLLVLLAGGLLSLMNGHPCPFLPHRMPYIGSYGGLGVMRNVTCNVPYDELMFDVILRVCDKML